MTRVTYCYPSLFLNQSTSLKGRRNRAASFARGGLEVFQFCEIFGGVGAIAGANTFDIRRDSTHNIHSDPGLREAALMMVFTVWEGLCVMEPTCSSFLRFVSTHTSGRTPET